LSAHDLRVGDIKIIERIIDNGGRFRLIGGSNALDRVATTYLVIYPVYRQDDELLTHSEQVRVIFHKTTVGPHNRLRGQTVLCSNTKDGVTWLNNVLNELVACPLRDDSMGDGCTHHDIAVAVQRGNWQGGREGLSGSGWTYGLDNLIFTVLL
jgi:hypothetical protein